MRHLKPILVALLVFPVTGPVWAQVQQDPELTASRIMVRAMTRSFLEDHQGALELLGQVLTLKPQDPTVLSALAETYLHLGDHTQALFYAERAVQAAPQRPENHRLAAELREISGDAVGALEAWEVLSSLEPGDASAHIERARLLAALEQRTQALEAYGQAESLGPLPTEVLGEYLSLQMALGHLDNALRSAERLALLAPTPAHFADLGRIRVRLGMPDAAAAAFQSALRLAPGDPELTEALRALDPSLVESAGTLRDSSSQTAGQLARAAEADLRNQALRLRAIDANLQARDLETARRLVEDGLLFFPGQEEVVARAVDCYIHTLNPRDALRALDQLSEAARSTPRFQAARAAVIRVRDGTTSALPQVGEVRSESWRLLAGNTGEITVSAEIPSSLVAAALVRSARGNPAAAAAYLTDALEGLRATQLELLFLGDLLDAAGDRSGAVAAWRQVLELAPSNPIVLGRLQ